MNHCVTSSASLEAAGDFWVLFYVLDIAGEEFLIYGFTTFPWAASLVMAVDSFAGEPDLALNIGFVICKTGIVMPCMIVRIDEIMFINKVTIAKQMFVSLLLNASTC